MKQRNKQKRLERRQKAFDELDERDKQTCKRPGSYKRC